MDKGRFEELKKKRFEEGLSDEEAGELGRFFAEEGGEQYQSTESFRQEQEAEVASELEKGQPAEGSVEDRPETAKEEAESRPAPEEDQPGGTREPLWAREEETEEK